MSLHLLMLLLWFKGGGSCSSSLSIFGKRKASKRHGVHILDGIAQKDFIRNNHERCSPKLQRTGNIITAARPCEPSRRPLLPKDLFCHLSSKSDLAGWHLVLVAHLGPFSIFLHWASKYFGFPQQYYREI
jgi:hypothetical protein